MNSRQRVILICLAALALIVSAFFLMRAARHRALTSPPELKRLPQGAEVRALLEATNVTMAEVDLPEGRKAWTDAIVQALKMPSGAVRPFFNSSRSPLSLNRTISEAGWKIGTDDKLVANCFFRVDKPYALVAIAPPPESDAPAIFARIRLGSPLPMSQVLLPSEIDIGGGAIHAIHGRWLHTPEKIEPIWERIAKSHNLNPALPQASGFAPPETNPNGDTLACLHLQREEQDVTQLTVILSQAGGVHLLHLIRGPNSKRTGMAIALLRGM